MRGRVLEPALLLALLSNKTEPFFAAVTVYNPVCPKNQFLLAKSCTEVYDPQQYLLKLQVTASANSLFLLGIFYSVQIRAEIVARILSCAQNLFDKCIFDAGLFTGTQMAEKNAFLAEAEWARARKTGRREKLFLDMELFCTHGASFLLHVNPTQAKTAVYRIPCFL